jgi:membrane-anchored mycosin MYCP
MTVRRVGVCAAVAGLALLLLAPAPAYAAKACEAAQPPPAAVNHSQPDEDKLYDPARPAAIATGAGVRVAVIDSGVDDAHPQLKGHVSEGADFLRRDSEGRQD